MGAARSNTPKKDEAKDADVVDKPAEGESVQDAVDEGLSPDPAVTEAVAEGLEGLDIDPDDIPADAINTNVGHPTVDLGETTKTSVRVEDLGSYPPLEQGVLENYQQLRKERDWSWEDVANHVEHSDPRLAAYFRSQGDKLDAAPRGTSVGSFETR